MPANPRIATLGEFMSYAAASSIDVQAPQGRQVSVAAICKALILLPIIVALALRGHLQPWVFMWLLAAAIFAECKAVSWSAARDIARRAGWKRNAAYLFLWPGMNAQEFLDSTACVSKPLASEWLAALTKTLLGAACIWLGVRRTPHALLAAWVGMLGLILLLHFGFFHVLSLAWRTAGIAAPPIMQKPLRSESLSEFWGKRWNLGYRQLSHDWVFVPLKKAAGLAAAMIGAFLVSGLIHDFVISLPAHAGYGLPTAYFLLQGIGVMAEHTKLGIRAGLGHGFTGWLWTLFFTAGPAFWLFHPWFATRVMLPSLRAIGAGC